MSDGPLDAWSEVPEWFAELRCLVTDDHDVISDVSGTVVGTSHTRWEVVTSGRLGPTGMGIAWLGDGRTSASWEEEKDIDESGEGWMQKARSTASGSGTGTGTISLELSIELTDGSTGRYSIGATGLTFEVATTSWLYTRSPVPGDQGSETFEASTGTREVFFPAVDEALPHSGLVLEGNRQVSLAGSAIAHVSWSVSPVAVPCNLTGISPTTVTLFVRQPRTFTAEGTGLLANVRWRAPGGTPATGTGATFTTKWLKTGEKILTATCGGGTKTATVTVLDVEIQINNTPSANDDLVQVKWDHPPRSFRVPCQIRLSDSATAPVTVELINPDYRLRLFDPADPTRAVSLIKVELPANQTWKAFEITGEKASEKKGDAEIKAYYKSDLVAVQPVTVFSFDQAQILLKKGGNYRLVKRPGSRYNYTVPRPDVAVSFSAKARLRPAGLDCRVPQIADLRIGIMQQVSNYLVAEVWDTPTIAWGPSAQNDDTIEVETVTRVERAFDPAVVTEPVNDGKAANAPLYDYTDPAVKRPIGCAGAGAATSTCTPANMDISRPSVVPPIARVTWTRLVYTTVKVHVRTFCVVFDQPTQHFCALRQAIWTVNVDSSGPSARQHAIVHADAAVSADPVMPPPTWETAPQAHGLEAVGTAKTKFTFKKK
jgi:hypothetical protein